MLKRVVGEAGRATLVYFPAKLIPALAAIVALPVFTSYLDPSEYGAYAYVFSTVSFLSILSMAWLTTSAIRFYAQAERESRLGSYLTTLLASTVVSAVLLALLVVVSEPLWMEYVDLEIAQLALPGAALLITTSVHGVVLQILRAAQAAKYFAFISVPSALAGLLAGYLLLRAGYGASSLVLGQALGHAVLLPLSVHFARVSVGGAFGPPSRSFLGEFGAYGGPLIAANLASWVLGLVDRYVIEATRTVTEVGLYSLSYTLGDKGTQLVMVPFLMAVSPVIIATWERDGRELTEQLQAELSRYFLLLMVPVAVAIASAAPMIVDLMSGSEEYVDGWRVLPFVTFGLLLYGLGQIGVTGISLGKKTAITMQNTAVAATFNFVANLLLVPTYGYVAAGFTTLISYVFLLALHYVRSQAILRWRIPARAIMRSVLSSVPLAAILVAGQAFFETTWLLAVASGVLGLGAYAGTLLAIGGIDTEERAWIRARLRGKSD